MPLLCDLTHDSVAVALLRTWARRPWDDLAPILADRMAELGFENQALWVRQNLITWKDSHEVVNWRGWTRQSKRCMIANWTGTLVNHFGDFAAQNTLPLQGVACPDTPGDDRDIPF